MQLVMLNIIALNILIQRLAILNLSSKTAKYTLYFLFSIYLVYFVQILETNLLYSCKSNIFKEDFSQHQHLSRNITDYIKVLIKRLYRIRNSVSKSKYQNIDLTQIIKFILCNCIAISLFILKNLIQSSYNQSISCLYYYPYFQKLT